MSTSGSATVLCCPLAPARSGNGLAMRAGVLLEALAAAGPVDLVVVPLAGPAGPLDWARAHARSVQVVDPVEPGDARRHVVGQLADPAWRAALDATAPLAQRVRAAPPTLGAELADRLPRDVVTVIGLRVYVAPFAFGVARAVGVNDVVVDADDDDVTLLRALGDFEEADRIERLARNWLPQARAVWAASELDAEAMGARYGLSSTMVIPNAVRLPAARGEAGAPEDHGGRLLFVGNLTYPPNLDAARLLAFDVLPRVRAHQPAATLVLVGPSAPEALADVVATPGVAYAGFVRDLAPVYGGADVVVVPLATGAGTRIKVLEAAAFERPVVASSVAIAGLDLVPGEEVVVADDPASTAAAVEAVLRDPAEARSRAGTAAARVRAQYSSVAVGATIRRAVRPDPAASRTVHRVLWNPVEICGAVEVVDALAAVLPSATHGFAAGSTFRYDVERRAGGYRVLEDGDVVADVATTQDARDLVHARFHRRVFERVSLAGWLRVHGALVDLGGSRVLVVGREGAGKSTLALRLLLDGAAVQGDESALLRGRDAVAVARPLHVEPGTVGVVPELGTILPRLVPLGDIAVADPARLGYPWHLTIAPADDLVVLTGSAPEPGSGLCTPAGHTEVLPDLVDALFPVTESKPALLRGLAAALGGVRCHRLARATPEAMSRTLAATVGLG